MLEKLSNQTVRYEDYFTSLDEKQEGFNGMMFRMARCSFCDGKFKQAGIRTHIKYKHLTERRYNNEN